MEYIEKLKELGINADRSGKYLCPKCSDTRRNKADKCLSVCYDREAVLYKCHNCGFTGAVFYRDKAGFKKHYKKPVMPNVRTEKDNLYDYFKKRGISKEIVDKYKIEINDKKEIIFPYYKDDELVNIKYRTNQGNGKKTFRQEAEAEKTFFGMDLVKDFEQVVICEGEIDVLSFAEVGIEAVSVPQGASENKLECIDNCYEWLSKFKTYIISVDNDIAGDKLKANLLQRLEKSKCKISNMNRFKDANEALLSSKEDILNFVIAAEYLNPDGIISFYDCIDEILHFKEHGYAKGYSTGWEKVDEIFTIKTGYLMIVTGYPSRGKSFVVDNLLFNLSEQYGLKHLIASFESTNASHFSRIMQMKTEKKFNEIDGDEFREAYDFVAENFFRFQIDRMWNVDQIIESCEQTVRRYGIKTLTIDPYNRLNNDYKDREDKYIGSILSKLSMLAKKLDILVIFIAHPKKPDGEKVPNMYSISGSPDWYNMADYGLIIHRERGEDGELKNKPQLHVAKVKDFNLGNPSGGIVNLEYVPSRHKILDEFKTHGNYERKF